MSMRVKHGTVTPIPMWDDPDEIARCMRYDNLSSSHENAKSAAVYHSTNELVSLFFANEKFEDISTQLMTVVESEFEPKKAFEMDSTPIDGIDYKGSHYDWPEDRSAFYDALKADGYDSVIIHGGYMVNGEPAPDIAVLDESICQPVGAKLRIAQEWTPLMRKDELEICLVNISNQSLDGSFENDYFTDDISLRIT